MIFNYNNNITFIGSKDHYTRLVDQFSDLVSGSTILPKNISARLALVVLPVELKLYVASQCPHCPGVIRTLIPLALSCPHIHLKIIDGTTATEEAESDKIMSVPCLILDNGFKWAGAVSADEVVDMVFNMIIKRDPSGLTTLSLKMILEEGKADWIVKQMLEYNTMFKGFTGLITHETWSVRLGAMVVLEQIAEKAPELVLTIAPELIRCLQDIYFTNKGNIPIQGDIFYALGEIGDETVKDEITRMIEEQQITHPEILEAAQEAIESIESRM